MSGWARHKAESARARGAPRRHRGLADRAVAQACADVLGRRPAVRPARHRVVGDRRGRAGGSGPDRRERGEPALRHGVVRLPGVGEHCAGTSRWTARSGCRTWPPPRCASTRACACTLADLLVRHAQPRCGVTVETISSSAITAVHLRAVRALLNSQRSQSMAERSAVTDSSARTPRRPTAPIPVGPARVPRAGTPAPPGGSTRRRSRTGRAPGSCRRRCRSRSPGR